MKYHEYLKTKQRKCPFCHKTRDYVYQTEKAYLTYCLAPYHRYHILIVPKRHIVDFTKLTPKEELNINSLIKIGIKILEKLGYKDYSVLVRNGKKIGKSIPHLHYHLVPEVQLIPIPENAPQEIKDLIRDIMDKEEIKKIVADFKKALPCLTSSTAASSAHPDKRPHPKRSAA